MKPALILTACVLAFAPLGACVTPGDMAAAEHGHHHADFESGRFHVRIDGPKRPIGDVILIPGLSSSPEVWDALTEQLKGRYRVHRLHVQGFAGAAVMDNASGPVAAPVAEDLARYIAEQGLKDPYVIGHSMGGTIGLMLAARHPDAVGKLMVVDQIPFMGAMFGAPGATAADVTPTADQIYAGWMASTPDSYAASAQASVTSMIDTESLRAGPIADTLASDQQASAASFRELIVTDLRPELSTITAPTTVLYVRFKNVSMTDAQTDTIYQMSYANLPGAHLERIENSAHFIMLDQPDLFAAEVEAFLKD